MNKTIERLNKKLTLKNADMVEVETKLQAAWDKVFSESKEVLTMISKAENACDYSGNEYGDIVSYAHVDLSNFQDCKPYLACYLSEFSIDIDWKNECLTYNQGEAIIIQDDTRHNNGVWLNGKRIIDEIEYRTGDNEVSKLERNALIEKYMEKEGYFPGVFRVDSYGNVFAVNTKEA